MNDDDTVTIPGNARGDGIVSTHDVDATWLAQNRRADTAKDIVADRLIWLPGVVNVELVNVKSEIGDGHPASEVLMTIEEPIERSLSLPGRIDDIPLRVEVGGAIVDT